MKYKYFYCLIYILGIVFQGFSVQANELTLEAAIEEVLNSNPDIQAAHERNIAAKARIKQAKALDDPMVGVEFYNVPIDTIDVGRSEDIDYKIKQNIPFPGKRSTRGKTAKYEAEAVFGTTRGNIQDVLFDLKQTYYDLYRVGRLMVINQENRRLLQQLLGSTETAYATGKTGADVPLKAQVELSKLKNEDLLLHQEKVTHQSHLKALLGRTSHEDIQLPTTLKFPHLGASLEELQKAAQETRPEIATLTALAKREQSKVTEAKQELLPDFSFGFAYKQKPIGEDVWAAEAMMNIPFFWGKKRLGVQEAKAMQRATDAEERSLLLHTRHEVDQTYEGVKTMEKLIVSYKKEILPQSKTNLEVARSTYANGQSDFLTLIDAAKTYKELQGSYYEMQSELGISFAKLERMIGITLNKEAL